MSLPYVNRITRGKEQLVNKTFLKMMDELGYDNVFIGTVEGEPEETSCENIIAAHCLHLSDNEIRLIGNHHITCVHCPNSNLKLGSGYRFPMLELLEAGARVTLGTDGSASSNNLDMIEVMKTAALLQKGWRGDPTAVPATQILSIASLGHTIAPGQPACLFLADVKSLSDLVYASHGDCVAITIVDGKQVYSK